MNPRAAIAATRLALLAAALTLSLGGCAWDYLNHEDRVGYASGNAVKANLAAETTDPSHNSQYNTKGLGKDGTVIVPVEDPAP
ncbi:MAG: hypothetical protein ABIO40_12175 [Devosia sp.]